VHWATWPLGGLALVGAGLFAGFGIHSITLESCADRPTKCTPEERDRIVTERLVADVSLGVGGGLALATILVAALTYEDGEQKSGVVIVPQVTGSARGALLGLAVAF
jgi:hypothetical protein